MITALFLQLFNILKETINRLLGLPDFLLFLVGVRPMKKLRLRVVILRDERGLPLAREEDALPAFEETARLLARMAGVTVIPDGWRVVTAPHGAPKEALDVHCTDGAWSDDLGAAGAFYRSLMAANTLGTLTGYGAPITVYIVRSMSTRNGCSLGALTDYVTLEAGALKHTRRLMAHEIGHACGLFHTKDKSNVMHANGPGDQLGLLQAAVLRNSRHVTYL